MIIEIHETIDGKEVKLYRPETPADVAELARMGIETNDGLPNDTDDDMGDVVGE